MGQIIKEILELKNSNPNSYQEVATKWFLEEIKKSNSEFFKQIPVTQVSPGNFYFLFYDLAGQLDSSRMEQYAPCLVTRTAIVKNKPIAWILNWNFIPERTRILWFDKIVARFFGNLHQRNLESEFKDQRSWPLTHSGVYQTLAFIGFEYALREIRLDLINKALLIDHKALSKFLIYDTQQLTGVDPPKLVEIWAAKLGEGTERMRKLRQDLVKNFEVLNDELNKSMDKLEESKEFLSKL